LPIALRHRKARLRGDKAVGLFKQGKFFEGLRLLMSALAAWPLIVLDRRVITAIEALIRRKREGETIPQVGFEWDD
jgi:hypothetical protein